MNHMIFGLDPKHARGLCNIVVGILIGQSLWRASTRHWRMSTSPPIYGRPRASIQPNDHDELTLTVIVMVAVAIGMIWVHFAPDVSNIVFPNQWP
jgi:hypothetical protein